MGPSGLGGRKGSRSEGARTVKRCEISVPRGEEGEDTRQAVRQRLWT